MIETTLLQYLHTELNIPVYMEYPDDDTGQFLVLDRTSGRIENFIKKCTFIIQSYDDTKLKAAELNEQVKAAMLNAVRLNQISSVSLNSDYSFPDVTRKRQRYQAVFDLVHY